MRETSYALPSRLEQLGLPHAVSIGLAAPAAAAGLAWIARDARRGVPRHGRAACLVLATTPYLAVWYLAWAVPLAAVDEDRVARVAAVALTAYLLPQTIPSSRSTRMRRGGGTHGSPTSPPSTAPTSP